MREEKMKLLCNTYMDGEGPDSAADQGRGNPTALPCTSKQRLFA